MQLDINQIQIPPRMRVDYGDIEELVSSIDAHGLIQPIVLNERSENNATPIYELVAGGRRLNALKQLDNYKQLTHGEHFVLKHELPTDRQLELELEENIQRLDMSWQERCLGTKRIHDIKNKLHGGQWRLRDTAQELGYDSTTSLSVIVRLGEALEKGDEQIKNAQSQRDATKLLIERKYDEGMKYLAQQEIKKSPSSSQMQHAATNQEEPSRGSVSEKLTIDTTKNFYLANCIEWFANQPADSLDASIVTDPPFAIDMDNLQQEFGGMNIERVREEHQVEDNLDLLSRFISESYRVLAGDKFLVFFYDNIHWEFLYQTATKAGFSVQRWPLIWVKTHRCQNMAQHANFTKATEFAMVCRKGNATLIEHAGTNYWTGSSVEVKQFFDNKHTFVKPFGLWQWIFSKVALKSTAILDPFMGVGSSTIAAIDGGWKPLGIELNEAHRNIFIVKLADYYRNKGVEVEFV